MGFRMTDFPLSRTSPNTLDTDVDGFQFPSASTTPAAHFDARLAIQERPRPSPLAILRERLFLNSGSKQDLWLSATRAVVDGERRSRSLNRAWDFRSDLVRMAEFS